jgi:hypothetical protein
MSERRPSLQDVILKAVGIGLRDLYTLIPARVVKWDAEKQRANCQILVKQVTTNEQGERVVEEWSVVTGVPVQFPGAGGFRVTFPISDGTQSAATTGSLVFAHRSLDKWLTGSGAVVDPEYDHDHALKDAVFFPGLMPFGAALESVPSDVASFGSDSDGNGRVECAAGEVRLGSGATKEVARKGDAVNAGSLTGIANLVNGVVTFIYTDADGVPAAGGTTAVMTGGKITGGSGHIKAVD